MKLYMMHGQNIKLCLGQFLCPSSVVYSLYTQHSVNKLLMMDRGTVRNT